MFVPESIPVWNVVSGAGASETGPDSAEEDVVAPEPLESVPEPAEPLDENVPAEKAPAPLEAGAELEELELTDEPAAFGVAVSKWPRALPLATREIWASMRASCARALRQRVRSCDAHARLAVLRKWSSRRSV